MTLAAGSLDPGAVHVPAPIGEDTHTATVDAPPAAPTPTSSGVAVVLTLSEADAATVKALGPEIEGELHCTLAFLGKVDAITPKQLAATRATIAHFAARYAPIAAKLSGVGRFVGEPKGDAVYLSVDAPGLASLRLAIATSLDWDDAPISTEHGFSPHITVQYVQAGEVCSLALSAPISIRFDEIALWAGADRTSFPFAGETVARFSASTTNTAHEAVPYRKCPVVEGPWDSAAAVKRLRKWAGVDVENPPESAWEKYAQGFTAIRGPKDDITSYLLPHHDVVDGDLVTSKRGVAAAIAALNGARGGVDLPENIKAEALAHLKAHEKEWAEPAHKASARDRAAALHGKAYELRSVKLSAEELPEAAAPDADGYVARSRVQVAKIGDYKGHPSGVFRFTSDVFDQMVKNHQANPDGMVPFDYEHGSEVMDPASSVYQRGAPAVGWVLSLVNCGDEGLFANVGWVDPECVGYIRSKRYRFVSPAVVFGAADAETGKTIGPVLVSAAVTNRPFLQGMRPLTARADSAVATPTQVNPLDPDARSEILNRLRSTFGLPAMSSEAEILGAIKALEALLTGDTAEREGIDTGAIINSLRWCLGLPTLTSANDVLAEIRKALAPPPPETPAAAAARTQNPPPTKDPAAMEITAEHKALAEKHAKLEKDHEKTLSDHKAFTAKLSAAAGLPENTQEDKLISAIESHRKELEKAEQAAAARAKAEAENDAEHVAARAGITDPDGKAALLLMRTTQPGAFKTLYGAMLTGATAVDPTRLALTRPVALTGGAGVGGGALPPFAASDGDVAGAHNDGIHQSALALMRDRPADFPSYDAAVKAAASSLFVTR